MNTCKLNRYKYSLLFLVISLFGMGLKAQEVKLPDSEISVYVKGPFSTLRFNTNDLVNSNSRYGMGFGLQYGYYLNQNWSISAGLDYQAYRSELLLGAVTDSYLSTDVEGDDFEFRYSTSSYREWENLSLFSVPVRVQYETAGNELRIYASAGLSVGFPVSASYKSKVVDLQTAGYYPQWDALLHGPKFMGFGSWGNVSSGKRDLDIKTNYAFLFETGIKQKLGGRSSFYAGFFADIPLTSINKKSNNAVPLIGYNTEQPDQLIFNPVVNASPGAGGTAYADKLQALAVGIKFRFAFSL